MTLLRIPFLGRIGSIRYVLPIRQNMIFLIETLEYCHTVVNLVKYYLVFSDCTFSISRIVVAILLVDAMLFRSLIGLERLESVTSKPMILCISF